MVAPTDQVTRGVVRQHLLQAAILAAPHREAQLIRCGSIVRDRYEETGRKQDRGVTYG
jgi:hypothetical protein